MENNNNNNSSNSLVFGRWLQTKTGLSCPLVPGKRSVSVPKKQTELTERALFHSNYLVTRAV